MATIGAVLSQIRTQESGGNYTLTPQQNYAYPASHASGAYQFQPATWQQYTASSGIGTQYSQAYLAPPNVQDAVATYALQKNQGNANSASLWGASSKGGGYPIVTDWSGSTSGSTIATGPADTSSGANTGMTGNNDPLGYSVTQNPAGTGTASTPGSQPGTTEGTTQLPVSVGVQPGMWSDITTEINKIMSGTATAFETAVGTWLGSVQNWFARAGLIMLGVIILAIALVVMLWDHGGKEAAGRMQIVAAT